VNWKVIHIRECRSMETVFKKKGESAEKPCHHLGIETHCYFGIRQRRPAQPGGRRKKSLQSYSRGKREPCDSLKSGEVNPSTSDTRTDLAVVESLGKKKRVARVKRWRVNLLHLTPAVGVGGLHPGWCGGGAGGRVSVWSEAFGYRGADGPKLNNLREGGKLHPFGHLFGGKVFASSRIVKKKIKPDARGTCQETKNWDGRPLHSNKSKGESDKKIRIKVQKNAQNWKNDQYACRKTVPQECARKGGAWFRTPDYQLGEGRKNQASTKTRARPRRSRTP